MQSFDRESRPVTEPSAWICRWSEVIPPGTRVLDLASGNGRHARWLASRGFRVVAADIDVSGLAALAEDRRIEVQEVDLEDEDWPYEAGSFGGIVVANYLHRPHFPHLIESLAPDGALIVETFGAGNERYGRPRNPDFLLRAGELIDAFHPELQIVAFEHGLEWSPRPAVRQRICAVRGPALKSLPGQR